MVDLAGDHPTPPTVRSETVLEVLDGFTPVVEIVEPGTCLVPTLGPARYHGGEESLARRVHNDVVDALGPMGGGGSTVVVTVAGGPGISLLVAGVVMDTLASDPTSEPVLVLGNGSDVDHLAPVPITRITHLVDPATIDLFMRLGLVTVGAFADLPSVDVRSRFGSRVAEVHQLVNGRERERSRPTPPPVDMGSSRILEPPLGEIDQIAFVARSMAQDVIEGLSSRSVGADTLLLAFGTDTGERSERSWRVERGLSVSVITQRVRWQVEGWIRSRRRVEHGDVGGVSSIRIEPRDLRPHRGVQIGFWGDTDDRDRLVLGGLDRIRGLFGPDAVTVPRLRGGRSPYQSHRMVGIDDDPLGQGDGRPVRNGSGDVHPQGAGSVGPWPGSIPRPFPTRVWPDPVPARVLDGDGLQVGVSGRGVISSAPELLSIDGGPWSRITKWAGPWCVDERWWDPVGHRRKARIQVLVIPCEPEGVIDPVEGSAAVRSSSGVGPPSPRAHLLTLEVGEWWLEATYD